MNKIVRTVYGKFRRVKVGNSVHRLCKSAVPSGVLGQVEPLPYVQAGIVGSIKKRIVGFLGRRCLTVDEVVDHVSVAFQSFVDAKIIGVRFRDAREENVAYE